MRPTPKNIIPSLPFTAITGLSDISDRRALPPSPPWLHIRCDQGKLFAHAWLACLLIKRQEEQFDSHCLVTILNFLAGTSNLYDNSLRQFCQLKTLHFILLFSELPISLNLTDLSKALSTLLTITSSLDLTMKTDLQLQLKNFSSFYQACNQTKNCGIESKESTSANTKPPSFYTGRFLEVYRNVSAIGKSTLVQDSQRLKIIDAGGGVGIAPTFDKIQNHKLIDAYKYNQYHFITEEQKANNAAIRFMQGLELLPNTSCDTLPLGATYLGSGSTALFGSAIIPHILFNEGRTTIFAKNIIIIPTPTYGLFVSQTEIHGGKIAELPLKRINNYKVNPSDLTQLINKINIELLLKSKQYLQINLDNIKQILTAKKKFYPLIKEVNDILISIHFYYNDSVRLSLELDRLKEKLDSIDPSLGSMVRWPARVLGILLINPNSPFGAVYSQNDVNQIATVAEKMDIAIIADYAHHLIRRPSYSIGSFAKCSSIKKLYQLHSFSKHLSAPGYRLAFMYVSHDLVQSVGRFLIHTMLSNSLDKQHLFIKACDVDKHMHRYLHKNDMFYEKNFNLLSLLVSGIPLLKDKNLMKFITTMLTSCGLSLSNAGAINQLLQGLNNINIEFTPEAGFFAILNFNRWKGFMINDIQLNTGVDFYLAMYAAIGVEMLPNEAMGVNNDKIFFRFLFGIDTKEVVQAIWRLHHFLASLTPPNDNKKVDDYNKYSFFHNNTYEACALPNDDLQLRSKL